MPTPADQTAPPAALRHLRVLVIAGSNCREYNCPGVDSKARTLLNRLADRLPATWDIDTEDLGNVYGRQKSRAAMPA